MASVAVSALASGDGGDGGGDNNSGGPSAGGPISVELTENIQFMKLVHELKASFPTVPDDVVKNCVLQVRYLHRTSTSSV